MLSRLAVALVLMGLVVPTAEAQRVQSEKATRRQLEGWSEALQVAHQELLDGNVKKGQRQIERTRREMLERLRGGPATPHLFGQVSFLRALAAAMIGDERTASWDFQVALELSDGYHSLDLARYGEAGVILERARTQRRERLQREAEPREAAGPDDDAAEVVPPRKTHSPQPTYPLAHQLTCGKGRVVLQAIIDKQGRATQPAIKEGDDPILFFVAFDAVRDWEFEPARKDGEAVPVYYNLTVNFALRGRCVTPLVPLPWTNERPPLG